VARPGEAKKAGETNKLKENKFLRNKAEEGLRGTGFNLDNLRTNPLRQDGSNSTSSSKNGRYKITNGTQGSSSIDVLNRDHNMARNAKTDEINRRLEILKLNASKQETPENVFSKLGNENEKIIGPDPSDIDEDYDLADRRSQDSNQRRDVYSELGRFEKRFEH
jgi:hypothetical protein